MRPGMARKGCEGCCLPVDVPTHVALHIGLEASLREVICFIFLILTVKDESLHGQRLPMLRKALQNLKPANQARQQTLVS